MVFDSLLQILSKQTEVRKKNLSQKRKQPDSRSSQNTTALQQSSMLDIRKGISSNSKPIAKTTQMITTETRSSSSRRIVSAASIADPTQDSAGGARVWASNEKASDVFANVLIRYIIGWIWPGGITLDWVESRDGKTTLNWNDSYSPLLPF